LVIGGLEHQFFATGCHRRENVVINTMSGKQKFYRLSQ